MLRVILCRKTMQLIGQVGLVIMMGWFPSYCLADEILFKDKGVQAGTVTDEDEQTVTIRFPRDSIQSVVKMQKGAPLVQKSDPQLIRETRAASTKNRTSGEKPSGIQGRPHIPRSCFRGPKESRKRARGLVVHHPLPPNLPQKGPSKNNSCKKNWVEYRVLFNGRGSPWLTGG